MHQQQISLYGHNEFAHHLFVMWALGEVERLTLHLLLHQSCSIILEVRHPWNSSVVEAEVFVFIDTGGDEGASVAELDLSHRVTARCTNVSMRIVSAYTSTAVVVAVCAVGQTTLLWAGPTQLIN